MKAKWDIFYHWNFVNYRNIFSKTLIKKSNHLKCKRISVSVYKLKYHMFVQGSV